MYFYYGNTRIKVSEHFSDKGKPIGMLLEDVIRYSAAHQTAGIKSYYICIIHKFGYHMELRVFPDKLGQDGALGLDGNAVAS